MAMGVPYCLSQALGIIDNQSIVIDKELQDELIFILFYVVDLML